jgi:predicted DNA-binding protein (MmcQ/YjbR family)
VERVGIIPAPYLARAHWVSVETETALSRAEIKRLIGQARDIVIAKLPKKTQAVLVE